MYFIAVLIALAGFLVFIAGALYLIDLIRSRPSGGTSDEHLREDRMQHTERGVVRDQSRHAVVGNSLANPRRHLEADIAAQAADAESAVERSLRGLHEDRYFVFRDLIIPSVSNKIGLTQIDHVVISKRGIFCVETKSNRGNIYGYTRAESWKQYLGKSGKPYNLHSPYRQNRHHVASLENLLGAILRAPIHSYIAFPNAKRVVVDGVIEDMSAEGIRHKMQNHVREVYSASEVEKIAKILAHAGTLREQLRGRHAEEVRAFLHAKT